MKILRLLVVNLIVACFSFSAFAEQRFALLIGNQTYGPKVGALNNPHNDIELVGKALARVGFNVVSKKDLSRSQMMREIDEYSQRLSSGGPDAVGFFYYSGHGASNPRDRRNYIIPTDVTEIQDLLSGKPRPRTTRRRGATPCAGSTPTALQLFCVQLNGIRLVGGDGVRHRRDAIVSRVSDEE